MVIQQIDIGRVSALEAEDDPPIGPYRYAPEPRQLALERMQAKARQRHVIGSRRAIQARQHNPDLIDVLGVHPTPVVDLVQAPQAAMLEVPDDASSDVE